jgi:hypothetical protein
VRKAIMDLMDMDLYQEMLDEEKRLEGELKEAIKGIE